MPSRVIIFLIWSFQTRQMILKCFKKFLLYTQWILVFRSLLLYAKPSCPSHQSVSKCFSKFFTTYQYMQWPSCQTFEYMEKCFNFAPCDSMEAAYFASVEYGKVHNTHLPKEAILAVHENLRRRCEPHCHKHSEQECVNKLASNEYQREKDHALIMEIKALKKQLDLKMSSPTITCQQMQVAMKRLHTSRRHFCDEESVFCLCKRFVDDLARICTLRCDQFTTRKNEGSTYSSSMGMVIAMIIMITNRR